MDVIDGCALNHFSSSSLCILVRCSLELVLNTLVDGLVRPEVQVLLRAPPSSSVLRLPSCVFHCMCFVTLFHRSSNRDDDQFTLNVVCELAALVLHGVVERSISSNDG